MRERMSLCIERLNMGHQKCKQMKSLGFTLYLPFLMHSCQSTDGSVDLGQQTLWFPKALFSFRASSVSIDAEATQLLALQKVLTDGQSDG